MPYKEADFGGYPQDELDILLTHWGSTVRPAGLSDATWIANLADKVTVLEALVREEHAAANAVDDVDVVSVVMKAMAVRQLHLDVVNGAPLAVLLTAIADLQNAWSK